MATTSCHIRSISLPTRPHNQRVEEILNKLKMLEVSTASTAETICSRLLVLEDLHKCVDDLLNLTHPSQHGKWFEDLLEQSMRILDVCGTIRELVSQCKEHVRDVASSIRRRKQDSNTESNIVRFASFRKKMKKDARRLVLSLKQMNEETEGSVFLDAVPEIAFFIRAMRKASASCIPIFQMLLSFMCVPLLKPKSSKWSLVSRLVYKGRVSCEVQEPNINMETRLETFESQLDSFENGLERVYRCLIRSRSSLLNTVSF
ncbi:hypothetical protein MTR67_009938 [Solanum verrucosum]|uniref:Uncharacterized protein n=2 Tax=Solanum TaxID=4107 RepID=A0ABQ7VR73_SOLTU|nr:uncharacterized protein LOC125822826 [Solanum verrucosum]KAH0718323.1 hypothetical protein KY285_014354 [Solanum tuberosum]KAH0770933.1 hypothetical protein KY290_014914 [Solanum tuberosum]WMV16553.1 hypothetical protein MTR67_009938 [Solanum verrucosum]